MNLKTQASWMWATLVRLLVARCSSPALVVGEVLAQAIIRRYGELMATLNRYLR